MSNSKQQVKNRNHKRQYLFLRDDQDKYLGPVFHSSEWRKDILLIFWLLCGPGIKYSAFLRESGQMYGCFVQLSTLSLSDWYIITLSPILSLTSLQFIENPPLLQQFSLLNELPIFISHGVENLGLLQIQYPLEIPLVSQTSQQMSGFHPLIRYTHGLYEIKPYTAFLFLTPHWETISSHCTYKVFQVWIKVRNTCSWICRQTVKMVEKEAAYISS